MYFKYFLTVFSVNSSQFWSGTFAWKGMAKQKPTSGEYFETGLSVEKFLLLK